MTCAILQWVADQTDLTPHLQGVLLRLSRLMDDDGRISLAQAKIAPHMAIGERQTRAAIKALVENRAIIRKRCGSVGKGRAPDILAANFERQHDSGGISPVSRDGAHIGEGSPPPPVSHDNGERPPVSPIREKSDNGDNAAASPVSDAVIVDNLPAHIEHASARAAPELITTDPISSEQLVLVGESETPSKRGSRMCPDWRPSREVAQMARQLGIINGWHQATLENFIDYWLSVPGAKGIKLDWNAAYRNELRKEVHARRHIPPTEHETGHDYASRTANAGVRIRREPVNATTAARLQRRREREARNQPIDIGSVDSIRLE